MDYYPASKKKNKILHFATTWMNFGDIMLNEMSEERQILYDFTYVESKNKQNKQRQTHRCRDQLRVIRVEAGRGMGEMNKEVNCTAINVYYTCGGYNFIVHTYVKV